MNADQLAELFEALSRRGLSTSVLAETIHSLYGPGSIRSMVGKGGVHGEHPFETIHRGLELRHRTVLRLLAELVTQATGDKPT